MRDAVRPLPAQSHPLGNSGRAATTPFRPAAPFSGTATLRAPPARLIARNGNPHPTPAPTASGPALMGRRSLILPYNENKRARRGAATPLPSLIRCLQQQQTENRERANRPLEKRRTVPTGPV